MLSVHVTEECQPVLFECDNCDYTLQGALQSIQGYTAANSVYVTINCPCCKQSVMGISADV